MSPIEGRGTLVCRCDTRLAGIFAITSLLAVSAGCLVGVATDLSAGVSIRNAAAWVIGAVLALLLSRIRLTRLIQVVLVFTPLALVASLLGPGQSGVHRWIALGPLNWNAALLWLPAATVALAAMVPSVWGWTWWIAMVIELALCLQPDASQATAFAAATLVTLLTSRSPGPARVVFSFFFVLAAGFSWTRPDPLQPVTEVEGILQLAGTVSVGLAALCVMSLAAASAAPLFALRNGPREVKPAARALCVYFLSCAAMPLFGAFPVPLVGMGMSPIIGFWTGIGMLMAAVRKR